MAKDEAAAAAELKGKIEEKKLEAELRRIAAAAKAEEATFRGGSRTRPRYDLHVDGLPEAGPGPEAGAAAGPAPAAAAELADALEDLEQDLAVALQVAGDVLWRRMDVAPAEEEESRRLAEALLRVVRKYDQLLLSRYAAEAALVVTAAGVVGPRFLEAYLRQQAEAEAGAGPESAADVADRE